MVSMNKLSIERQGQIISCLTEGMSIRGTVRVTGAAKNTVSKLLVDLGQVCAEYQDKTLRNLECKTVEADEIWSFCYSKQKNVPQDFQGTPGYGDVWTWVAIDADTKLVPSWLVGERTMADVRVHQRSAIPFEGSGAVDHGRVEALPRRGGALMRGKVDYAVLHKLYGAPADGAGPTPPARCIGVEGRPVMGTPTPTRSARPMWSGRTSPCEWGCGASPD